MVWDLQVVGVLIGGCAHNSPFDPSGFHLWWQLRKAKATLVILFRNGVLGSPGSVKSSLLTLPLGTPHGNFQELGVPARSPLVVAHSMVLIETPGLLLPTPRTPLD